MEYSEPMDSYSIKVYFTIRWQMYFQSNFFLINCKKNFFKEDLNNSPMDTGPENNSDITMDEPEEPTVA